MTNQLEITLNQRKEFLVKMIKEKKKSIKKAPKGRLRTSKARGNYYYYLVTEPNDTTGKYIKRKDISVASKLAQRDYDQDLIHIAEKELGLINKLLSHYKTETVESVYNHLGESRKKIVQSVFLTDDEYAEMWQSKKYQPKEHKEGQLEYCTKRGELVCSKSELIIANTLYDMNIPYRYEAPLALGKEWERAYPDFTVLNKRTRRVYYLEHFGMMDNYKYLTDTFEKIRVYQKNGIYLGESFFFTSETEALPLQVEDVMTIIKKYLL